MSDALRCRVCRSEMAEPVEIAMNRGGIGIRAVSERPCWSCRECGTLRAVTPAEVEVWESVWGPELGTLPHGLYEIHWKEGGTSLAAVGSDREGRRWYAPTNWIEVPCFDWSKVQSVKKVETA